MVAIMWNRSVIRAASSQEQLGLSSVMEGLSIKAKNTIHLLSAMSLNHIGKH